MKKLKVYMDTSIINFIAYSTIFQMDVLLSWNFKHLANINKEQKVLGLNKLLGYNHPFRMANPLEVYFDE